MMVKQIFILATLMVLVLSSYGFSQQDRSEEISRLKVGIESPQRAQRVKAAKSTFKSGVQDQELYQMIANLIKSEYKLEYEKNRTEELSWMCKALASSGDPQYRELLEEVARYAPSAKLSSHARQNARLIDQYAERNKALNANVYSDESLSGEENRLINMLISADIGLRRDAAKIIVQQLGVSEKVFTLTAFTLSDMAKNYQDKSLYVDTMAWLCKALAASGDAKYVEVLDQIIDNTEDLKLKKYASRARNDLK